MAEPSGGGPTAGTDPPSSATPLRSVLIRPQHGRYVAGVCAGLGRATGTDPVLWRVVLAVLLCFGGIGALAYLGLWLLTAEEGDTASPLEAVLGRGRSSTSPMLSVVLAVIAGLLLVLILPRPVYLFLLGGATVLVVLLYHRASSASPPAAASAGGDPPGPPGPAAAEPAVTEPAAPAEPATAKPASPEPAAPEPTAPEPAAAVAPAVAEPTAAPTGPLPPFTRGPSFPSPTTPFAPHGPFVRGPALTPPPARAPQRSRERSALTPLVFCTMLLAVGLVGVLDLAGAASIPAAGYVATALVVVGAGLLVGAWLGRARPMIVVGALLALALPVVHVGSSLVSSEHPIGTSVRWAPTSTTQLEEVYQISFGEAVLDLRQLELTEPTEITARVSGGEIRVQLPPDLPVTVEVRVSMGSAQVLGEDLSGFSLQQTVTDPGEDPGLGLDPADPVEPTRGELILNVSVSFGAIQVER